ncbi:MAG: Holliday junction branch migration DNA helicase RuvB, partial [Selenomonadaceae bacterium]|nr:Holliday junction branch migration DNA helicase RuvB [Selenomonadaceae bacterium]
MMSRRSLTLRRLEKFLLAAAISESRETIEDIYEPYLLQLGFIMRTPRGRVVTEAGYLHMGVAYPKS